jgi:hypothetical protein
MAASPDPAAPPRHLRATLGGCALGLILGIFLGALLQLYFPGLLGWLLTP